MEGIDIREPDATPPLQKEHFSLTLEDGMRVQFGSGADEAYQTVRPLLLRIVESYRRTSATGNQARYIMVAVHF